MLVAGIQQSYSLTHVCVRSVARLGLIPRSPMDCSTTGFLVLHYLLELLKFMFIESVMLSNHLILCRPRLPSVFPSIQVFSNGLALSIRWPKYFSFSFSISPSSEYSGLISFRIDWFDLLAVQETLESSLTPQFSCSLHRSENTPGSKYSSTSGLSPRGHLERQAEFHASTQDES